MVLPTINGELNFKRKLITIDGSMVTSETGIPLGLNINLPGVDSTGKDVRLAKLDGTPIAREIECVGVPNAEDVMIWYPFDTVDATNSQFWVYWGNTGLSEPAADSTYGSQNVWDDNYVNVWRMAQDPSGDAPQLIDSTGNNDATSEGSMTSGDLVDTSFGKGIDFDGSDDGFSFSNTLDVNTVSIMARIANTGRDGSLRGIVGSTGWNSGDVHNQIQCDNTFSTGIKSGAAGYGTSGTTLFNAANYGTYRNLYGVYDGGAGTIRAYVDGVNEGTTSSVPSQSININPVKIGQTHDTNRDFQGIIGELWISKIVRSSNYILTNHNNLNNPTATGTTPFYLSFSEPMHQRRTPQFL